MKKIIITEGTGGIYGYETTYILTEKNEVWRSDRHMKYGTRSGPLKVDNPFPAEVWEALGK